MASPMWRAGCIRRCGREAHDGCRPSSAYDRRRGGRATNRGSSALTTSTASRRRVQFGEQVFPRGTESFRPWRRPVHRSCRHECRCTSDRRRAASVSECGSHAAGAAGWPNCSAVSASGPRGAASAAHLRGFNESAGRVADGRARWIGSQCSLIVLLPPVRNGVRRELASTGSGASWAHMMPPMMSVARADVKASKMKRPVRPSRWRGIPAPESDGGS